MKTRLSAALLFLALPGAALAANDVVVHRDPGCGCCDKWAQALRAKLGRTDFGAKGFGGACPPPKDKAHRYVITVFALKVDTLEVPDDATAAMIGFFLNANALGRAKLTATFKR